MLASVHTAAILGLEGRLVEVQVDIAREGVPHFLLVGLPDDAVREAREQVRAAVRNSGLEFPLRRITIQLAPAQMPKNGPAKTCQWPCGACLLQISERTRDRGFRPGRILL